MYYRTNVTIKKSENGRKKRFFRKVLLSNMAASNTPHKALCGYNKLGPLPPNYITLHHKGQSLILLYLHPFLIL